MARLRDEDIPYTVVGGLSLFDTPEIRDLEQALRAIADPHDDVALVRMMTAGPWRLDALEILRVTRTAKFDRAHLLETVRSIVASGQVEVDVVNERREDGPEHEAVDAPAVTRAKLRQLLGALDELNPLTFREGPHTILERFLERTGTVLDLIAADTLESKRTVANIASFMRFAADWQAENPRGTLAGFVAYLDAYQGAGGELPTSVELSEDVDGVRLMTLYQAKGLEFPIVFVPSLLDGEWPVREGGDGMFPRELLREAVPAGDIHTDEERRLLYVAMTRAQERLILTTHGGAAAAKEASRFVGEILDGAGVEVRVVDRTGSERGRASSRPRTSSRSSPTPERRWPSGRTSSARSPPSGASCRCRPPANAGSRCACGRASSSGSWRRPAASIPRRAAARDGLRGRAGDARPVRRDHRRRGARPGTRSADVPDHRARRRRRREPPPGRAAARDRTATRRSGCTTSARSSTRSATSTGCRRARSRSPRSRSGRRPTPRSRRSPRSVASAPRAGEPPPTREDLEAAFRARWTPTGFGDKATEEGYQRRVATLLDNFWTGEVSSLSEALHEELDFELTLEPGGRLAARRHHRPDRPHRPPALGRHRGPRLQDRPRLGPEGRRREPPALDLRARLPRRAGPRARRSG